MDFCEDDLDQLGEAFPRALALAVGAGLRDAVCGSARFPGELLGSGVCLPVAVRRVFPLIPINSNTARSQNSLMECVILRTPTWSLLDEDCHSVCPVKMEKYLMYCLCQLSPQEVRPGLLSSLKLDTRLISSLICCLTLISISVTTGLVLSLHFLVLSARNRNDSPYLDHIQHYAFKAESGFSQLIIIPFSRSGKAIAEL